MYHLYCSTRTSHSDYHAYWSPHSLTSAEKFWLPKTPPLQKTLLTWKKLHVHGPTSKKSRYVKVQLQLQEEGNGGRHYKVYIQSVLQCVSLYGEITMLYYY